MSQPPRVTLDQWRVIQTIVDQGGFAQAAKHLHRSQSAVSYAVSKLQEQLGFTILKIEGRKAHLTESGEALLDRARQLLAEASAIENFASQLARGRESEIRLVVDAAYPTDLLMPALSVFSEQSQGTRIELREVILSGAADALRNNDAELVIGADIPNGFLADPLVEIEFIAVAHPSHPLHQLNRILTNEDLEKHMHVVIRDSGEQDTKDVGWLNPQQRWTVSNIDSAFSVLKHGLGFGWLPSHRLVDALAQETLKPLQLEQGQYYRTHLFMSYGHPQDIGPATRELAEIIKQTISQQYKP